MKQKLIIRPEAEAELREAYRWYEDAVEGLGSDFLLSVDACLNSVLRNPKMYPVVHKSIHMALTRRFPYEVFYITDKDRIVVLAIFNASRNPEIWKGRN